MKKLDKIKKEFLEQFQNKLDEEHVDLPVELAFDILISADPSPNKKYVRWLIEIYINDGFLFEDINAGEYFKTGEDSKIYETLEVFMKHSQKLEPVNRSVNKYKTIADMWKMVKQYA